MDHHRQPLHEPAPCWAERGVSARLRSETRHKIKPRPRHVLLGRGFCVFGGEGQDRIGGLRYAMAPDAANHRARRCRNRTAAARCRLIRRLVPKRAADTKPPPLQKRRGRGYNRTGKRGCEHAVQRPGSSSVREALAGRQAAQSPARLSQPKFSHKWSGQGESTNRMAPFCTCR